MTVTERGGSSKCQVLAHLCCVAPADLGDQVSSRTGGWSTPCRSSGGPWIEFKGSLDFGWTKITSVVSPNLVCFFKK